MAKCRDNFKEVGGRCVRRVRRTFKKDDEPVGIGFWLLGAFNVILLIVLLARWF
ncbi:MAG: hypothetical protein ABH864_05230 [archaeon]